MALFIPKDGQLTSQNILSGALTGGEVMYIVSPGNALTGNSFQITTATLAGFFGNFVPINATLITSGSTYLIKPTDTRILVEKTIGGPITITVPSATTMTNPGDILIKDVKGDAGTNGISLNFTTSCDGLTGLQTNIINNPYGWLTITPVPGGSTNWYMS
jgi:hypothetical protein